MDYDFMKVRRRNKYQIAIDKKYPHLKGATIKDMALFFKERLPNNRLEAQKYIYKKYITDGE
tara:strand:- start:316 stop:501 length:186 start_codon:yes stop_codon:yes gene_type:complete